MTDGTAPNNGAPTQGGNQNDIRNQHLEIKNILPVNVHIGYETSSELKAQLLVGKSVSPRILKEFYRAFWYAFHYVKSSVDADKLDPEQIGLISAWFDEMRGNHRDTNLISLGIDFFTNFAETIQSFGVGRMMEKGIDPPFTTDDFDMYELLIRGDGDPV